MAVPAGGGSASFVAGRGCVRSMPLLVRSNAHASAHATGNPIAASTMTSLSAHAGTPSGSKTASATWMASHAATR